MERESESQQKRMATMEREHRLKLEDPMQRAALAEIGQIDDS